MSVLLNAKHERFAQEIAKGKDAGEAYETAGFKPNPGNARRLKLNEAVRKRVEAILSEREHIHAKGVERAIEATGISIARVLEELAKLGFANMLDYVSVGSNGDPYVDLSALDRDKAAAVQEVTVEDFKDGRGDDARDVRRVKFKLYDKRAALVDIGKHLGMFKERVELTGKDGGPVETADVTERESFERRIAGVAARVGADGTAQKPH